MNENINLVKILKDCPEGFELYSTVLGEVKFVKCINLNLVIVAKEGEYYYFTRYGKKPHSDFQKVVKMPILPHNPIFRMWEICK